MPRGWQRIWRLLTLRPCELCGHRLRCWRWHVEMFACPVCGTEVSEFEGQRRDRVVRAIWEKAYPAVVLIDGERAAWDEGQQAFVKVGGFR